MEKENLMRMNLQYFADGETVTPDNAEEAVADDVDETQTATDPEDKSTDAKDTDKIVEKLQERLGKETGKKKEAENKLQEALDRITELEKGGKKSVKEKTEEQKAIEAQQAKDDEIARLKSEIQISKNTQEVDEVLKDADITAGKEILGLLVSEDVEETVANAKAFINFINEQQGKWETERNRGKTPKIQRGNTVTVTQEKFDAMTYSERSQLAKDNPEQFRKLTGGI